VKSRRRRELYERRIFQSNNCFLEQAELKRQQMQKLLKLTLLADLMRERTSIIFMFAIATGHLILVASGVHGWQCPLLQTTGIPCPGCGLSRATVALLKGQWKLSLTLHAFAPILLAALALVGIACFLPQQQREKLICFTENFEKRTRISLILGTGLIAYWLVRLLYPVSLALVVQK